MKKHREILIICTTFLFFLSACTKFGKNVTVKGRVLNPITGEGIEGVEVKMWKNKIFSFSSDVKLVKKVTSDLNGYFEIDKLGLSGYDLKCDVSGDYYPLGWTQDGGASFTGNYTLDVKKGKVMHADYYAVPYGNLQINIKNLACFDTNDELSIYRTHSIFNFYDHVPNPAIYMGCVDQTGNMNKAPMGWYKYSGTVTKNGIILTIKDSIYLNEDETKVWNINY
jgi:hypothetical protein